MFDFSIDNFEDHISKSIKGYKELNEIISDLSIFFIDDNSKIFDIGSSNGNLLKMIKDKANKGKYYGIDIEKNFAKSKNYDNDIIFINDDIRTFNFIDESSIILSIFTLQFLEISNREKILKKIYNGLKKSGCLIIAEKVHSKNSTIENILTFSYYDFKGKNFSHKEILEKEKNLRGHMRLYEDGELEEKLKDIGFIKVGEFWRTYNFRALIAIK